MTSSALAMVDLPGAGEAGEEDGEALPVARRVGAAQLLDHLGEREPVRDLQPFLQAAAQLGAGEREHRLARLDLVLGARTGRGSASRPVRERHHRDVELVLVLREQLLGGVGAVEGLAGAVVAGAGMVAADDQVGAAVVLADDRVPERLARAGHAHGQRQDETKSSLVDYEGKYYRLRGVSIDPKPFQKPRPPIMIASWGSEQGLRRVANTGDGWMASAYNITPDKFKEKWNLLLTYRRELNKDVESFENSVMTMFGYIDNDKQKVHRMAKEILSPALGRSADELENLLLFGTTDQCLKKIDRLYESGVKRIHFWPVNDYIEQIEIFFKEIAQNFG